MKNKKIMISTGLILMLLCFFSTTPVDSHAVGTNSVAKVNETEYNSLQEAINSIEKEGVIEIISDMEIDDPVTVPANVSVKITNADQKQHEINLVGIKVESGGSLTVDGNLKFLAPKKDKYDGMVICNGTFILENGVLDANGNTLEMGRNGIVSVYGENAEFIMNGGTIKNVNLNACTGGVRISDNGKFTMNGGAISNISGNGASEAGAVLVYADNKPDRFGNGTALFTMNGGTIKDNTGYRGAGVHIVGVTFHNRATMIMNGGIIKNNTCDRPNLNDPKVIAAGAGIYIDKNAEVTMNGGTIENNKVNGGMGGGVASADNYYGTFPNGPGSWTIEQYSVYYPAAFTMNGGSISSNASNKGSANGDGGCGGGIYIASNKVKLTGGKIENNYAERQGGGVYVGSIPYELKIENAVVKNNEANKLGGGIWACPTGDVKVYVANGGAVYDNKAKGAGDDVVSVKNEQVEYKLTLSDRVLGGGQVLWYQDGGLLKDTTSILGEPDNSAARYDSESDAKPISQIQDDPSSFALKSSVSDNAKMLAEKKAALVIQNNSSERGGGIGTNGGVIIGETGKNYTLQVKKAWENDDNIKTVPVTVYLKIGDIVLDSITLNDQNNWTSEFTQLPEPAALGKDVSYAVVENPVPDNYIATYSDAKIDEGTQTISIDITNTYREPTGNEPSGPDKPDKPTGTKTGDNVNMMLLFTILIVSGASAVITVLRRKNVK